jgi:hypothetical protein
MNTPDKAPATVTVLYDCGYLIDIDGIAQERCKEIMNAYNFLLPYELKNFEI